MLIVSVQNFDKYTQNIIDSINTLPNIFAIRTDRPIKTHRKIIGLKKNNKLYYITTNIKDINSVSRWCDYVAIDCRYKNQNLDLLLEYCVQNNIKIIADISTKKDINHLYYYKQCTKYVATTFCSKYSLKNKSDIIKYGCDKGFKVIAEGGYNNKNDIRMAIKSGASHICIGDAIFNYIPKIKEFIQYCYD